MRVQGRVRVCRSRADATAQVRCRIYDAQICGSRFLEVDPVEGGSSNDYDYVGGDCINSTDLSGTAIDWGTAVANWEAARVRNNQEIWYRAMLANQMRAKHKEEHPFCKKHTRCGRRSAGVDSFAACGTTDGAMQGRAAGNSSAGLADSQSETY